MERVICVCKAVMTGVVNVDSPLHECGITRLQFCLYVAKVCVAPSTEGSMPLLFWNYVVERIMKIAPNKTFNRSNKVAYFLAIIFGATVVQVVKNLRR